MTSDISSMGGVLRRESAGEHKENETEGLHSEKPSDKSKEEVYEKGANYWNDCEPTVDAMLGGYAQLSDPDISANKQLLKDIFKGKNPPGRDRAVDCGAGIGRVTRLFLQHHFKTVDLVEKCPKFVEKAKELLGDSKKVGKFICCGLEEFVPEPEVYDVVWCQWVLAHLSDDDLVVFLQRCANGLKPSGMIIVKENVTKGDVGDFDEQDGSTTRSLKEFKEIFKRANLRIVRERKQPRFPKDMYPVYMFALRSAL